MNKETAVIIVRAGAKFFVPFCAAWTASLAQWIGSDNPTGPPKFVWWAIVIPASIGAGWSGLDGFFSGAWQSFVKNGKADAKDLPPTENTETPKEIKV